MSIHGHVFMSSPPRDLDLRGNQPRPCGNEATMTLAQRLNLNLEVENVRLPPSERAAWCRRVELALTFEADANVLLEILNQFQYYPEAKQRLAKAYNARIGWARYLRDRRRTLVPVPVLGEQR